MTTKAPPRGGGGGDQPEGYDARGVRTRRRRHGTPPRGQRYIDPSPLHEGRFGRMFDRLDPLPELPPEVLKGLADGMKDERRPPDGDNPAIPSGYTYFGQFIDHDITFDPTSSLGQRNDPAALVNFRSPRLDLDSIYGSGPADEPFLYEPDDRRLLVDESNENGEEDLPRTERGTAIIGDPRNDENTIVSQLQLIFLKLHNRFVDQVEEELRKSALPPTTDVFAEAQRRTRWHYQWVVVHDFLKRIVGEETHRAVLRTGSDGRLDVELAFYKPDKHPFMPVEFSGAAYRYGHSQVRGGYALNDVVTGVPIFVPGEPDDPRADLRGGHPLPSQWTIEWDRYLDMGGSDLQHTRLIDTKLARGLFDLPGPAGSLALANLRRGEALGLPSGQDVATRMGIAPLEPSKHLTDAPIPTPLWFYCLREAEALAGGAHLGPVAGRIVAEVLLGLLVNDKQSYGNVDRTWKPQLLGIAPEKLELKDLVRFAQSKPEPA